MEELNGVENPSVEIKPVEAQPPVAPVALTDDPEVTFQKLQAELEKTRSERDNYKKGLLARKGKIEAEELDLTDPVQLESYINKTVEDRLLATKEEQASQELKRYTESLARKNKELALALANKNVISGGAGSGSGTSEKMPSTNPDSYWSEEQVKLFKSQGKSDEWIKRAADNARKMGA